MLRFSKILYGPFTRCTCEINQTDLGNVPRGMPGQAISIDIFLLLSLFLSLSGLSFTLFFPLFNLFLIFSSLSGLSLYLPPLAGFMQVHFLLAFIVGISLHLYIPTACWLSLQWSERDNVWRKCCLVTHRAARSPASRLF